MSLAEQKLQQNIAEYILFIWQMEDLVRAVYFDPESLNDFIRSYTPDQQAFDTEKEWFRELIRQMRSENVEHHGHINGVHELIFELNYLHNTLLNILKDKAYVELYQKASPNIQAYLQKSDGKTLSDVEVCLLALYGLLVLRLKREVISTETEEAMNTFKNLIAQLSHQYKIMKQNESNYTLN